nr:hypothetical protein [Micromonospora provocatoris]
MRASLPPGSRCGPPTRRTCPASRTGSTSPAAGSCRGEERTFDVVLRAPAGTSAGELGSGSFTVQAVYEREPVADVDPADDTTTFSVRATD